VKSILHPEQPSRNLHHLVWRAPFSGEQCPFAAPPLTAPAVRALLPLACVQKLSKAQKRREKMAAKDAQREARIAAGAAADTPLPAAGRVSVGVAVQQQQQQGTMLNDGGVAFESSQEL
jgi:hypothetical protein